MSDSWQARLGKLLIEGSELLAEFRSGAWTTDTAHSESRTKNTSPGVDVCRYCGKDIYLSMSSVLQGGPQWIHADNKDSHCGTFATPKR